MIFLSELAVLLLALAALFVVVKIFSLPLRFIYNGLMGAALLWLLNIFGAVFGLSIGITAVNSLVAGFFGVPGIIFLLVYKYIF
ncbi:MAG: pro-sigmaK processing inhibitor BofA family protein [Acidaminococcales bacterium]|jgi:inhibitor of the pro-sigma K processing machinery|nr:pro-sigmaK processing inhibitor BofA family protein [Acidaminococcales bacterium]